MSQFVIASQLDEDFNEVIRQRLNQTHPESRVIGVPPGVPSDLPAEVNILLARPINVRGYQAPDAPPPGWPYGLQWIQVVSSGIDFYPQWLFNGPPVSTSRGSAAENIAEFALAAIFAAAKHLPDIWVHDSQWNFTALTPLKGTTLGILGFGEWSGWPALGGVSNAGLRDQLTTQGDAAALDQALAHFAADKG